MMDRKRLILLMALMWFSAILFSQSLVIKGVVTSSDDGGSLPGVTIKVNERGAGTVTDVNGKYTINMNAGESLSFSFVGYETVSYVVKESKTLDVVLKSKAAQLSEVVVTGLGIKRQQRELGYSTEKINNEELIRASSSNVISAITGKSAGVLVSNNDGVDGGTTRITIRGNNNLTKNNQPLIVIDNIPMENTPGIENIGRGVDWGNAISDLNPYDIDTYTVLKGGAASAIYGARGANGVILITTKRGRGQKGLGVTYNFDYKITHPYRYRDVQNTYGAGGPISFTEPTFPTENGVLLYPGIYSTDNLILDQQGNTSTSNAEFGYYGSAVSWGPKMEGQMVKWWDGEMRAYSPQPDNLKLPYSDGFTRTHNIEASANSDKGSLRISLTRQDHTPIIENSNYDRTTVNFGANMKVSERLHADVTMTYVNFNRLNSPVIGEDANSINKGLLYSWPRSYMGLDKTNYQNADGTQNLQDGYPFKYVDKYIWWNYYNNNTTLARDKFTGGLSLSFELTSWLNVTARGARDYMNEQYESKKKPTDVLGKLGGGYTNKLIKTHTDNFDLIFTASKDKFLGSDWNVRLSGGANRYDNKYYSIYGHSGTWYFPNMYTFLNYTETIYVKDENGNLVVENLGDLAGDVIASEKIIRKRINSVFGFADVSYKDWLFVDVTGRNDWSSTLPSYSNSYFYPSVSVSFVASEAFKIQDRLPWMNFVKLRGAIAQTASDDLPYSTEFYYNISRFGGVQMANFPDTIPPYTLKPQRVNSYEAGINIGLFENRIDLDFTYYYKYSFDQILNLPLPTSAGANMLKINEGSLSNRGLEITLNTVPYVSKVLTWKAGFSFWVNHNKIISLGDYGDSFLLADIWGENGPAISLKEGDDYGTIVGYDYIYDKNGNKVVSDDGTHYLMTDTRVPIGNASPDFTGGFNTQVTWKDFTFSASIDSKIGGDIYCGSYVIGLQTGQSPETLLERDGGGLPYTDPSGVTRNVGVILDGVYADGTPNNKVVHYYYKYMPNAGGWGKILSTPGIVEDSWIKLREVSVSYKLPNSIIRKIGFIQGLTFTVTGRDLFYIYSSVPDNINPEGIMGTGNAQGFEWASYPGTRSFSFSLSANF